MRPDDDAIDFLVRKKLFQIRDSLSTLDINQEQMMSVVVCQVFGQRRNSSIFSGNQESFMSLGETLSAK